MREAPAGAAPDMGEDLQVALLGSVEVCVDGQVRTPASASQRIILACLALAPDRVVPTADLFDALWVGDAPANATGNLQTYVSRLRRVVGLDRIIHEPAGYRLRIDADDVDIGRVEQLVAQARDLGDDEPARAADRLDEALAVWRGEPLADLADPLAFAPVLARLSSWRRQLREERFGLRLRAGQAAAVLPALQEAVVDDPMSEGLHVHLVQALHQVGRTADALEVADSYRRRLAESTGLDPSRALSEAVQQVLADDPQLRPAAPADQPSSRRDTRPRRRAPGDRFVGRADELAQARAALSAGRVVTVVGPGGAGKTRLVLELLDQLAEATPVHLVELGDVADGSDLSVAVAAGLGLQAAPAGAEAALTALLGVEPALLVLDGCEHVRSAAQALAERLLADCPTLQVVATSRQPLGLAGAQVIRLGPLDADAQVELLIDRASRLRADFDPSPQAREAAAAICAVVDGLPLALELAARREAVFGFPQLRDRLTAGLQVLDPVGTGDRATAVTATVEWSYRLIAPESQVLFDRLAVCRGAFPLEVVDHLAPPAAVDPAPLLAELVDASLVVADVSDESPRYRLLEVMRHVGLRHLSAEEADDARSAHARWAAAQAARVAEGDRIRSAPALAWVRRERGGLADVLSWLVDTARWDAAGQLAMTLTLAVCEDPDLVLLGQLARLEQAVVGESASTEATTVASCATAAGAAAWLRGDDQRAEELLAAGREAAPEGHPSRWISQLLRVWTAMYTGDPAVVASHAVTLLADPHAPPWARANGVCCTAMMHVFAGDRDAAEAWMTREPELLADVAQVDGFIAYTRGELAAAAEPEQALVEYDRAMRRCQADGHRFNREVAAIGRAAVLVRLGRHAEAVEACAGLIDRLRHMGMWPGLWTTLRIVAELLVELGDHESAAVLLLAAEADQLAPVVIGPDRARQAALWEEIVAAVDSSRLEDVAIQSRRDGRTGAVAHALTALGRLR